MSGFGAVSDDLAAVPPASTPCTYLSSTSDGDKHSLLSPDAGTAAPRPPIGSLDRVTLCRPQSARRDYALVSGGNVLACCSGGPCDASGKMHTDYTTLSLDELELLEKQTLRTVVQAVQQYSREARSIFETTYAASDQEVIVLGEDLVQYALEVAEVYPIDKRFAGFIDYKRVRWLPLTFGLIPQVLLVDAKASTENNRETLQQSQLPMDASWTLSRGNRRSQVASLLAGVIPGMPLTTASGAVLQAVTTTIFIHWYYSKEPAPGKLRQLKAVYIFAAPHALLKPRYNPDPDHTIFGEGKHSPGRAEVPRVRIYYRLLKKAKPWRLQELTYVAGEEYTVPLWRDEDASGAEMRETFEFLPR